MLHSISLHIQDDSMFQKLFGSYDLKTELTAGMSVFLAMIYIVPLNALILSDAGMPYEAVVTATALITILATATNAIMPKPLLR